jgi:Cu+-exporting ATPase
MEFFDLTLLLVIRTEFMKENLNNTQTGISCCSDAHSSHRDGNQAQSNQLYTCPMHPEIQQDEPGSCPICGMSLEPMIPSIVTFDEQEIDDLSLRFWVSAVLSIPLLVVNMGGHLFSIPWLIDVLNNPLFNWGQLLFASPIVIWGGGHFGEKHGYP